MPTNWPNVSPRLAPHAAPRSDLNATQRLAPTLTQRGVISFGVYIWILYRIPMFRKLLDPPGRAASRTCTPCNTGIGKNISTYLSKGAMFCYDTDTVTQSLRISQNFNGSSASIVYIAAPFSFVIFGLHCFRRSSPLPLSIMIDDCRSVVEISTESHHTLRQRGLHRGITRARRVVVEKAILRAMHHAIDGLCERSIDANRWPMHDRRGEFAALTHMARSIYMLTDGCLAIDRACVWCSI